MRETEKHRRQKKKAIEWLKERNIDDILIEAKTLKPSGDRLDFITWTVDVVGRAGSLKIAIECGGTNERKLNELLSFYNEVWIFPYGGQGQYRWWEGRSLCHQCGAPLGEL